MLPAAYVSALNDTLFFLFGSLALLLTLKTQISGKRAIMIGFLLVCSLLSKETGLLFLIIIIVFQYLFRKKNILISLITGLSALAVYCVIHFALGGLSFGKFIGMYQAPIAKLSVFERLINMPAIFLYYLTTTFYPVKLAIDQQWIVTKITVQNFYLPIILDSLFLAAAGIVGVYFYTKNRNYFKSYVFFAIWFLSGMPLLLQFFPLEMTVADSWFYFPLVGLLGMAGIGIQALLFSQEKPAFGKYGKVKTVAVLSGVILIILLSLRTVVRNADFHDQITLYSHDTQIQVNPRLETDLEKEYVQSGLQTAFALLQKSTKLSPTPTNLFDLGNLYEKQGNAQKAAEYYDNAITIADTYYAADEPHDPNDERIYIRFAGLLLLSNAYESAAQIISKGLHYFPESSILLDELALSENMQNNHNEAIVAANKAKTLAPSEETKFVYNFIVNKKADPFIVQFETTTLLKEHANVFTGDLLMNNGVM
jgi:tetratricopeptide (TPR) repeat protein